MNVECISWWEGGLNGESKSFLKYQKKKVKKKVNFKKKVFVSSSVREIFNFHNEDWGGVLCFLVWIGGGFIYKHSIGIFI